VYLMISKYVAPLDEVDRARPAHLAFLDGLAERGLLISAGRQTPAVGGVVILDAPDEAAAHALMADDPYVRQGLANYTATGWEPSRGALADYKKA